MNAMPAKKRRAMILDEAWKLFSQKGYQATTIEDVLAATGIAKGTLYYYFRSKDDIMMGVIERTAEQIAQRAQAVVDANGSGLEKLLGVIAAVRVEEAENLAEELHARNNTEFHITTVTVTIEKLAPVLAQVIAEGVEQGEFTSEDPLSDAEIILTVGFILSDDGFFPADAAHQQRRMRAILTAIERILGVTPGAITGAI